MTYESASTIIDKLSDAGVMNLFLTGGEPTIVPFLDKIILKCINCNVCPSVSSNGSLLTSNLARRLKENGLPLIQISFQSANSKLDAEYTGAKEAFEMTLRGLDNTVNAGLRTVVSSVGMRTNIDFTPETADFVAARGAQGFRLLRLMTFSQEMLSYLVPKEKLCKILNKTERICKKRGLEYTLHAPPGLGSLSSSDFLHPVAITCYAGKTKMDVLSDGSVYPCRALRFPEFYCGNLITESVDRVWNAPPMRQMRELTPEDYKQKCGKCTHKWGCYSCRAIAYKLHGGVYNDDISCYKLNKT